MADVCGFGDCKKDSVFLLDRGPRCIEHHPHNQPDILIQPRWAE